MEPLSLNILLDYIYNKFAITLLLCIIGSSIKEYRYAINNKNKIDLKKILLSSIFSSFLLCACSEYIVLPFSSYAFISILLSMWGFTLIELSLNSRIVVTFIKILFKTTKSIILKSISSTMDEIQKQENTSNSKESDSSNKNN